MKPTFFDEATSFIESSTLKGNEIEKGKVPFWAGNGKVVTCIEVSDHELKEIRKTGKFYIISQGDRPHNLIMLTANPLING